MTDHPPGTPSPDNPGPPSPGVPGPGVPGSKPDDADQKAKEKQGEKPGE